MSRNPCYIKTKIGERYTNNPGDVGLVLMSCTMETIADLDIPVSFSPYLPPGAIVSLMLFQDGRCHWQGMYKDSYWEKVE